MVPCVLIFATFVKIEKITKLKGFSKLFVKKMKNDTEGTSFMIFVEISKMVPLGTSFLIFTKILKVVLQGTTKNKKWSLQVPFLHEHVNMFMEEWDFFNGGFFYAYA